MPASAFVHFEYERRALTNREQLRIYKMWRGLEESALASLEIISDADVIIPCHLAVIRDLTRLQEMFKLLKIWSGRRESDPQPTAWKAVTLPLSYSRSKTKKQSQLDYIKRAI
jgi:hypothetical protein